MWWRLRVQGEVTGDRQGLDYEGLTDHAKEFTSKGESWKEHSRRISIREMIFWSNF